MLRLTRIIDPLPYPETATAEDRLRWFAETIDALMEACALRQATEYPSILALAREYDWARGQVGLPPTLRTAIEFQCGAWVSRPQRQGYGETSNMGHVDQGSWTRFSSRTVTTPDAPSDAKPEPPSS